MSSIFTRSQNPPRQMLTGVDSECFATNFYHDRTHGIDTAKILPGQYFVTDEEMMIVTVLGSCVSACIRDPELGIGGMNHFMLPDSEREKEGTGPLSTAARYGSFAMELLINHLLKMGGRRSRLEAKVFGGGNVLPNFTTMNVGQRNADFVLQFLKAEQIRVTARDLVDTCPRKVYYFPTTGKVLVKRLTVLHNNSIAKRETDYRLQLGKSQAGGDVELFG
jgi:chemotaxis protein CheD